MKKREQGGCHIDHGPDENTRICPGSPNGGGKTTPAMMDNSETMIMIVRHMFKTETRSEFLLCRSADKMIVGVSYAPSRL